MSLLVLVLAHVMRYCLGMSTATATDAIIGIGVRYYAAEALALGGWTRTSINRRNS